jgi:hypothetical protein
MLCMKLSYKVALGSSPQAFNLDYHVRLESA